MIALRVIAALLVLAAIVPEFSRYVAERRLYRASAVVRLVFARPNAAQDAGRPVAWATSAALEASAGLPGDWRPLNLAAATSLLARRGEEAVGRYREALALGERPEIVANLGRAYVTVGRQDRAVEAFLRAGWVSPAVLAWLPAAGQEALRSQVRALERELASGRLSAPPPLPP